MAMEKLSPNEASDLWRNTCLIIHTIKIEHNHTLRLWEFWNRPSYEFDRTGKLIRLNCIDSDKKLEYSVVYTIKTQEVDNGSFVARGKLDYIEHLFPMKDGKLDDTTQEGPFYDEELIIDVYTGDEKEKRVAFGCFWGSKFYDRTDDQAYAITAYDFLYQNLLFCFPLKRKNHDISVNHNKSMIATHLNDGKDTIVILYPVVLNFLNYRQDYDMRLCFNRDNF